MVALRNIQLYVADYLADTAHLSAAEHGGYFLLIMNYWQKGKPLLNVNERLASAPTDRLKIISQIHSFILIGDKYTMLSAR